MFSWIFFISKNYRESKKWYFSFAHAAPSPNSGRFGGLNTVKYKIVYNFGYYFWRVFFEVKGSLLQIFNKKIIVSKPMWSFENENFWFTPEQKFYVFFRKSTIYHSTLSPILTPFKTGWDLLFSKVNYFGCFLDNDNFLLLTKNRPNKM